MSHYEFLTIMLNAIIDKDTGVSIKYRKLIKNSKHRPVWVKLFSNNIGWLAQVFGGSVDVTGKLY